VLAAALFSWQVRSKHSQLAAWRAAGVVAGYLAWCDITVVGFDFWTAVGDMGVNVVDEAHARAALSIGGRLSRYA
jgi:hypothetical protein